MPGRPKKGMPLNRPYQKQWFIALLIRYAEYFYDALTYSYKKPIIIVSPIPFNVFVIVICLSKYFSREKVYIYNFSFNELN